MNKRLKKPVGYALDPVLLDRLEAWRMSLEFPPSKTAVLEQAIRDFLDRKEVEK